jgi:hypothetical protein
MKRIIVFIFVLIPLYLNAQVNEHRITCNLQQVPFESFIEEIEKKSPYRFYYSREWTDTLLISILSDNQPIEAVLVSAFEKTSLQYYVSEYKVIVTKNVPIIEGLDDSFFVTELKDSQSKVNYSFSREYAPSNAGDQKKGNEVIEIGVRSANMKDNAILIGYVKDEKSGEAISGALLYCKKPEKGTVTDLSGFYSLSLPPGPRTLYIQYAGMIPQEKNVVLHSDGTLTVLMQEDVISLKEVIIESERDANIINLEMGKSKIDMKSMKNVPKILGENDLLRISLTLPGVKSVGEGVAGLNVRGGNADQNLIMLNEATIYNTSHFLGFFSVFNADAIKSSELYKSGMPAQYGGRLSSILDVQLKDGNQNEFTGQGGIGPVMARLNIETPIGKKTSIMAGGRTTYSNWVLNQVSDYRIKNSSASFYDLVGRVTHKLNDQNTFYGSFYFSNDKFKLGNDSLFAYSNTIGSFQWRHTFNRNLHSLLSATFSEYTYAIDYDEVPENSFKFGFGIKEKNIKYDFNYFHEKHKMNFGLQTKYYQINPGYIENASPESLIAQDNVEREEGIENALYIDDNIELTSALSVYVGLRLSAFTAFGPRTIYTYSDQGPKDFSNITDTLTYESNEAISTYLGPEVRMSARYSLPAQSSVKLSYNKTRQYVHMLSNTVAVAPTTTWKLSDPNFLPQLADQVAVGYFKNFTFGGNRYEASVEAYYKWLHNLVDYKTGSQLILNKTIERDVLQGDGKAYGIEFLIKKTKGKLNGWFSYTYSRTLIKLESEFPSEEVNRGNYFPTSYDKPHDFSLVANYKVTRRYSFSMNFVYTTGRPITFPVGQYYFGGGYKINYSDRNQFRIPDYIRLDVGVNVEGNHKIKNIVNGFWSFSVYNLLGRDNPYSIYFKTEDGVVKGYQLSIFGSPIPTVTYTFKF